ncbi:MAG TPA: BatD family protein, partial [Kofleriaceae bacterium]|nr:BatD family protein [Kofleriaceae bacterium]
MSQLLILAVVLAQTVPAPTVPAPEPAPVDAPTVSASASAQQVALGQVFYLFVRVVYEPGTQVNLPASLPLGPAFEETGRTDVIEKNRDGTLTRDYEIALQAFEVGELVIPPLPVTYAVQGRAQEVATQAVPIEVTS